MADWDNVRRLAPALPDIDEQSSHGHAAWWLNRAPKRVAREYAAARGLGGDDRG